MFARICTLLLSVAGLVPCLSFVLPVTSLTSRSRLSTRMVAASAPTTSPAVDLSGDGGVTRQIIKEGQGRRLLSGDIALVNFTSKVKSNGLVFAKADEYRCTLEDGTMISGWDIGLSGLCVGDEAVITCSSRYGYGSDGVAPVVPPNAEIEMTVQVLEHEGNIMNPASFADANPLTPRTPDSIRDQFDRKRQAQAAMPEEELEGLEAAKKWLSKIYIFGFFESLDGADAPWYLRPLITFPLMFAICGAAFYAVVFLNGITTDRGTAVIDDPEVAWDTASYLAQQLLRA